MPEIYLDNGATTRPTEGVIRKMNEALEKAWGNPSSLHRKGQEAEKLVREARQITADYLKTDPVTVYFTSCATESANTAIMGAAKRNVRMGKHILCAKGEHPATNEPLAALAADGWEVEFLENDGTGRVLLNDLRAKMRPDTALVCSLHVNNETGVVQPIREMGAVIKEINPRTLFYVDAVQSFGKMPVQPLVWQADLVSASAHKFHGPKGAGVLYVKRGLPLPAYVRGGGQERKLRSGTENVAGIAGLGQALKESAADLAGHEKQVRACKLYLAKRLKETFPEIVFNGPAPEDGAAHVLNVRFSGLRSEVLLHSLEDYNIYISSGSACASNKPEEMSPALSALGLTREEIESSARFSFCRFNTLEEVDAVIEALSAVVPRLKRYTRR